MCSLFKSYYYFSLYFLHYAIPTWCHFKQTHLYLRSYIDKYLQYMLWILYTCICIFSVTYIPHNIKYSMLVFAQIVHNLFVQNASKQLQMYCHSWIPKKKSFLGGGGGVGPTVICVCRGGVWAYFWWVLMQM